MLLPSHFSQCTNWCQILRGMPSSRQLRYQTRLWFPHPSSYTPQSCFRPRNCSMDPVFKIRTLDYAFAWNHLGIKVCPLFPVENSFLSWKVHVKEHFLLPLDAQDQCPTSLVVSSLNLSVVCYADRVLNLIPTFKRMNEIFVTCQQEYLELGLRLNTYNPKIVLFNLKSEPSL